MSTKKDKIVIIGVGLGACFMALNLAKRGYQIDMYEYRPDVRKKPYDSGRSFNLTFYGRGVRLMQEVGIWNEVKKNGIMVEGNIVHGIDHMTYDPQKDGILYTVHRNVFNGTLLDIIEKEPGITIHFNTRCVAIDKKTKTITLEKVSNLSHSSNPSHTFKVPANIVIGADGIHSTVRKEIQKSVIARKNDEAIQSKQNYRRDRHANARDDEHSEKITYEKMGYKELHISKQQAKKLGLELKKTHSWPREESLLLAFPNNDQSFTLMLNFNLEGKKSFATLTTGEKVGEYLTNNFHDLAPLHTEMAQAILHNPTGRFATLKTTPWYMEDFAVLIGDAAHACIPFYGQGTYAAFDDVMVFCKLLDEHNGNWGNVFPIYQEQRKKNTDILAQLSKQNFSELRDKSRSLYDVLKMKADTLLHRVIPNLWAPPIFISIAHGQKSYVEELKHFQNQQKIAKYIGINLALSVLAKSVQIMRKKV